MRAVLKLEIIADNYYAYQQEKDNAEKEWGGVRRYEEALGHDKTRPWVARLTGLSDKYGFEREFIHGQKDYRDANSVGSRGVYEYFPLPPGMYEVHERLTWKKTRRYFLKVEGTEKEEISRAKVIQCLKTNNT